MNQNELYTEFGIFDIVNNSEDTWAARDAIDEHYREAPEEFKRAYVQLIPAVLGSLKSKKPYDLDDIMMSAEVALQVSKATNKVIGANDKLDDQLDRIFEKGKYKKD